MGIFIPLAHWGRVTHTCVSNLTIIGSVNDLSPGRHQAIIWTSAGILSIVPLGTNFSETVIEIYIFSFKKMHFKMSSGKLWSLFPRLQCVKDGRYIGTVPSFPLPQTMISIYYNISKSKQQHFVGRWHSNICNASIKDAHQPCPCSLSLLSIKNNVWWVG